MRKRYVVGAPFLSLLLVACQPSPTSAPTTAPTGQSSAPSAAPSAPASPSGTLSGSPVAGGCGDTQVFAGPGPDASLGLEGNAWAPVTPAGAGVVAYFFSDPPNLVQVTGPGHVTKVLWIFHGASQPGDVTIDVHPLGASSPTVHSTIGYAIMPGGNYPSSIDVPTPGCWQVDLSIGTIHASLDLQVAAAP